MSKTTCVTGVTDAGYGGRDKERGGGDTVGSGDTMFDVIMGDNARATTMFTNNDGTIYDRYFILSGEMSSIHCDGNDDVEDNEDKEGILSQDDVAFYFMTIDADRGHVLSRDTFTYAETSTCPTCNNQNIRAFVTDRGLNRTGDVLEIHLDRSMAMKEALSTLNNTFN